MKVLRARGSRIGDDAQLGPFAFAARLGLEANARVGNFVELKKSRLGKGSKAPHLAYLGDAEIGPNCNIGAGTITCNYDGVNKYPTILGPGVFVGSDTQLVAPVTLGEGAYVAAGTTVTEDVPPGALASAGSASSTWKVGWHGERRRPPAVVPLIPDCASARAALFLTGPIGGEVFTPCAASSATSARRIPSTS